MTNTNEISPFDAGVCDERETVGLWKCPACGNEQHDEYEHGDYTCDNCGKVVEWLFVDWI